MTQSKPEFFDGGAKGEKPERPQRPVICIAERLAGLAEAALRLHSFLRDNITERMSHLEEARYATHKFTLHLDVS